MANIVNVRNGRARQLEANFLKLKIAKLTPPLKAVFYYLVVDNFREPSASLYTESGSEFMGHASAAK